MLKMEKWIIIIAVCLCIPLAYSIIPSECSPVKICLDEDCTFYEYEYDGVGCSIVSKDSIKSEEELKDYPLYTPYTTTTCDAHGLCHWIDYSFPMNVFKNGTYQNISYDEAESLIDVEGWTIDYLFDGINEIKVIDFNATSIQVELSSKDIKKALPLKLDGIQISNIKLDSIVQKTNYIYTTDDILMHNISFGATTSTVLAAATAPCNDSQMDSGNSGTNFGTAATAYIGEHPSATTKFNHIIKFNYSSISSNAVVSNAEINFSQYKNTAGCPMSGNYTRLLRDWDEFQVTWDSYTTGNSWGTGGAESLDVDISRDEFLCYCEGPLDYASQFVMNGSEFTRDVGAFINGSHTNYGWRGRYVDIDHLINLYTKEETNTSRRPVAFVEYSLFPPTFEPIGNIADKNEDFGTFTLDLSANISDTSDSDANLKFTWWTNESSYVTLDIVNSTDVATFTSVANASGQTLVNITVWDTDTLSNSTEFNLTVNAVNDAPTIPGLNAPLNNSYLDGGSLNWSNSTDADGDTIYYYLEVDDNSDFSSVTYVNSSVTEADLDNNGLTIDTPSGLSDEGIYYWRVLATDKTINSSWTNSWRFIYLPSGISLILYMDGIDDNRTYEYQTHANLTAVSNCSICNVYMGLDAPSFGDNYTYSEGKTNISYLVETVRSKNFTGNMSENLTFSNNVQKGNITIFQNITTDDIMMNMSGYDSTGYPSDLIIDILDDGATDISIPGNLTDNVVHIGHFADYEKSGDIQFASAGTEILYLNLSSAYLDSQITMENGTINLTGWASNPGNLSYDEYFWNNSQSDILTTNSSNVIWVWEDFSLGDIIGRWSGTYTVTINSKIADSQTETSSSCSSGDSGLNSFESLTLDLAEYGSVFFKTKIEATGCAQADGYPCGYLECNQAGGQAILKLKDKTSGTTTTLKSVSAQATACGWETSIDFDSDTSEWEIRKVNDKLEIYDDSSYLTEIDFDSTHQYEIYTSNIATNDENGLCSSSCSACGCGNGCGASGTATAEIHWINATGITGEHEHNFTFSNGTFTSKQIHDFGSSITSAVLNWTENKPTGTKIDAYLTADNGTNWESVQKGLPHTFSTAGRYLRYKFFVTGTNNTDTDGDLSEQAIVKSVNLQVVQGYPTNVSIDIGNDGTYEWNKSDDSQELYSNESIIANFTASSIIEYMGDNCLGLLECIIPFAIHTDNEGIISWNSLDLNTTIDTLFISNQSLYDLINDYSVENLTFPYAVGSGAGKLEMKDLDFRYKGDGNASVTAVCEGVDDTKIVDIRYSDYNRSFPPKIKGFKVIFNNWTQFNITPYGQEINYINESNISQGYGENESVPIWNISNLANMDKMNITVRLNESLNTCMNITCDDDINKTGGIIVNTTEQIIIGSLDLEEEQGLWCWLDAIECNASALIRLKPVFRWNSYCETCVFPTDLDNQTSLS